MASAIPYLLFATLLAAAAQDIAQLRISNAFPLIVLALYAANGALTGHWHIGQSATLFALFLGVGLVLFRFDVLGGGDVKLLCALAPWCSFAGAGGLLLSIVFFGGIVALLFMLARRLLPRPLVQRLGWPGLVRMGPIPYGVAIAAGTIFCFLLLPPSAFH